jgi:hypothetical protein
MKSSQAFCVSPVSACPAASRAQTRAQISFPACRLVSASMTARSGPQRAREHLIRRSRHIVQGRPLQSVCWADIPQLSARGRRCPAAWQQCWQQSAAERLRCRPSAFPAGHIPSWRGSCERYALSSVAAVSRWPLPLLSPSLSAAISGACPGRVYRIRARHLPAPAVVLGPRPSPHRTDCCRSIRRRGGVKG